MSPLQIRLIGPDLSSFSAHSHSYELSNELKSVLNLPNFRFGPYSPTVTCGKISSNDNSGVADE